MIVKLDKNDNRLGDFFALFPDNESARKQFELWRWGNTKRCPHCDSVRISEPQNQKMPYRCKDCRKRFSVKTNTVLANSNFDYQTWLLATYIFAVEAFGTASGKLAREISATQKSAWHLRHRIRTAWEQACKEGVTDDA